MFAIDCRYLRKPSSYQMELVPLIYRMNMKDYLLSVREGLFSYLCSTFFIDNFIVYMKDLILSGKP